MPTLSVRKGCASNRQCFLSLRIVTSFRCTLDAPLIYPSPVSDRSTSTVLLLAATISLLSKLNLLFFFFQKMLHVSELPYATHCTLHTRVSRLTQASIPPQCLSSSQKAQKERRSVSIIKLLLILVDTLQTVATLLKISYSTFLPFYLFRPIRSYAYCNIVCGKKSTASLQRFLKMSYRVCRVTRNNSD